MLMLVSDAWRACGRMRARMCTGSVHPRTVSAPSTERMCVRMRRACGHMCVCMCAGSVGRLRRIYATYVRMRAGGIMSMQTVHGKTNRGSVRILWGVCLLCVIVHTPAAQKADVPVLVEDTRETYRIGFFRFDAESLSVELEYLVSSVPRVFYERFQKIADHYYDDEELAQYRAYLLQQKAEMQEQAITTRITTRDQQLFANETSENMLAEEIVELREELQQLAQYNLADIAVQNPKPTEMLNLVSEYPLRKPSYYAIARTHDLDMLFDAVLTQDAEFVHITLYVYLQAEDLLRELITLSLAQDEIDVLSDLLDAPAADAIVGREWSTIVVEGVNEQDVVYLNGVLVGYGPQSFPYLPLGDYDLRLESEYVPDPQYQAVSLSNRDAVVVQFFDDIGDRGRIQINTMPDGASVYVNSIWQGITPLAIDRISSERTLLIRKSGYFDVKSSLNDQSEEIMSYTLVPELFDQSQWLFRHRDRFYSALAALIISVPIPIILNGVYENIVNYQVTDAYSDLPVDERIRIATSAIVVRTGSFVGIFASVVLAANAIFEAAGYVNAADFFHRL